MRTFLLSFAVFFAVPAVAAEPTLSPSDAVRIEKEDRAFEARLRERLPKFELVTGPIDVSKRGGTDFPISVVLDIPLRKAMRKAGGPPVIATLHSARTREPLQSCTAPCELKTSRRAPGFVVAYRQGSAPTVRATASTRGKDLRKRMTMKVPWRFNAFDMIDARNACDEQISARLASGDDHPAGACLRIAPIMPSKATRSGRCEFSYLVTPSGRPEDIRVGQCTEAMFCRPTARSVRNWILFPSIQKGRVADTERVHGTMSFRLTRRTGTVIDEPDTMSATCDEQL